MSIPAPPQRETRDRRHERLGRKPNLALGLFVAGGIAAAAWLVLRVYYFNWLSDQGLRWFAALIPVLVLVASFVGVWLLVDLVVLGGIGDAQGSRIRHRMRQGWGTLEDNHRRQTRRVGIAALVLYPLLFAVVAWLWFGWAWRLF